MSQASEETVKKTIKALLISSKGGCSPRQLVQDYRYVANSEIPYESFGHSTLMSYLNSLSSILTVSRGRDRTTLTAVPDPATRNISKLVSKQKSSTSSFGSSQRSCDPSTSSTGEQATASSSKSAQAPVTEVPSGLKKQLTSLTLSYPNGIRLDDLREAFARRFSFYFSYRECGFNNLTEMIESIPSVLEMRFEGGRGLVVTAASENAAAKTSGINWTKLGKDRKTSDELKHRENVSSKCPAESLNSLETETRPPQQPPPLAVPFSSMKVEAIDKASFLAELKKTKPPTTRTPARNVRRCLPKKLVKEIEELLRANPSGIWLSKFVEEFQTHHQTSLQVSSYGYSSVAQLVSAVSVCQVERPTGLGDWLVFLRGLPTPEVAQGRRINFEAYVSDKLVQKIHKLLWTQPNGIVVENFLNVYQSTHSEQLLFYEYGFHSLNELLQRVPSVELIKPPKAKLLVRFCKRDSEEVDILTKPIPPTSGPPQPSVYAMQEVPDEPGMFPVYVAHVKTPSCFTVQLLGKKTTQTLEQLQEDITKFYTGLDSDSYSIRTPYVGQPCCAMFDNDGTWYRAEIEEIEDRDAITVKYVDYGNSSQVPLGSLRMPKAYYLIFPAQGVQCRLANLKPAGSTWSMKATKLLFQMTKDKPIVAIKTAYKNKMLSLCLCDTNTNKDIHINDILVEQGLALFTPDTDQDTRDIDGYQLEGTPVTSTDNVPRVRLPEEGGKIATLPSGQANLEPNPQPSHTHTPSQPPTPQPPNPFVPAELQPHNLLQLSYLQQLMVLHPHLFLGQMNPGLSAGLFSNASSMLTGQAGLPGLLSMAGQTGQASFPPQAAQLELTTVTASSNDSSKHTIPLPPGFYSDASTNVSSNAPVIAASGVTGQTSLSTVATTVSTQLEPKVTASQQSLLKLPSVTTLGRRKDSYCRRSDSVSSSDSDVVFRPSVVKKKSSLSGKERRGAWGRSFSTPDGHVMGTDQSGARSVLASDVSDLMSSSAEQCMPKTRANLINRVELTTEHTLHVLCYNDHARFLSAEVSLWLWESDLLQLKLRQVSKPVWGRLLREQQARQLFRGLRNDVGTRGFLKKGQRDINIYNLEDLPLIISTFDGPPRLYEAVEREVCRWKTLGPAYFCPSNTENLETELATLQEQRKEILVAMISNTEGLAQLIQVEKSIGQLKERIEASQDLSKPPLNNEDILHPVSSHTMQEVPHPSTSSHTIQKVPHPLISDDLLDLPNPDDELPVSVVSDSGVNESGSTHSQPVSSHSPQSASTTSEHSSDVMAMSRGNTPINSTTLLTNTEQSEELPPVHALEEKQSIRWSDDDDIQTQHSADNAYQGNSGSPVDTASEQLENDSSKRDKTLVAFTSSSEDEGKLRFRNTNFQESSEPVTEPVVASDREVMTESTCSNWESLYDDEMMKSSSVPVVSSDVDLSKSHLPQEKEAVPDVNIDGWDPANDLYDEQDAPSQGLEFDHWPSLPIAGGNQTYNEDLLPSDGRSRIRIPSDEVWEEMSIPDKEQSLHKSIPDPLTQTEQVKETAEQLKDVVHIILDKTDVPQAHVVGEDSDMMHEEVETVTEAATVSVTSTTNGNDDLVRSEHIETTVTSTTDEQLLPSNAANDNVCVEALPPSPPPNKLIASSDDQNILLRTEASAIDHKGVELITRPLTPPTHTDSESEELQSLDYSLGDQSNTAEDPPPGFPPRMFANQIVTTQSYIHGPPPVRRSFPGSAQYEEYHPLQRYPGPPIISNQVKYSPKLPPRFQRQLYTSANDKGLLPLSTPQHGVEGVYPLPAHQYSVEGVYPLPTHQHGVEGAYGGPPHDPMFSPAHVIYHYPPYPPSPPMYYQEGLMYPQRPMNNEYAPRYMTYHQPPPYGYPVMQQPQYVPAAPPVVNETPFSPHRTHVPRRTKSAVPIRLASEDTKSADTQSASDLGLLNTSSAQQAVTKSSTLVPRSTIAESSKSQISTASILSTKQSGVMSMAGVGVSPMTTASPRLGLGSGRTGPMDSVPRKRISARSVGLGRGLSPGVPRDRRPGSLTSSS